MAFRSAALILIMSFPILARADPLTIYMDIWPPYNYIENDQIIGLSTELIEAALHKTSFEYQIKAQPWMRAYLNVQKTPYTALYTVNRSPQREKLFKWVGPLYPSDVYLFKLKKRRDINVNQLSDAQHYKVGVLRGGSVHQFLVSHGFTEPNLDTQSYADAHLKMLYLERVDLVPGDSIDFRFQTKQLGYDFTLLEKSYLLYKGRYYMAFSLTTPDEVVERVQLALDEVIKEGLRDRLIEKYTQ